MGIVAGGDAADLDRVGERSNIRRVADLIERLPLQDFRSLLSAL
jgi:hypothetical protein